MLSLKVEQRVNLKFLVNLNKIPMKYFQMLTRETACLTHMCLSDKIDSVKDIVDHEHTGHTSTSRSKEIIETSYQIV